jgi:hypothetical protein
MRSTNVSDRPSETPAQRRVIEAMHAVLSDDHNYERGLAALRDLVDQVVQEEGAAGLREFTVALSLGLAGALERIAGDQGLIAADLAEVWFAD